MFRLHTESMFRFRETKALTSGKISLANPATWLLVSDVVALILSYLGGILLVLGRCYFESGILSCDIVNLVTVQSFSIFWVIGFTVILWLDSRGHYHQRLPYWESVGHIVGAASASFIASGFIEFASRNNGPRLWTAFCWVLFVLFAFAGRAFVRRVLTQVGAWQIPAIVIGDGATASALIRAISRDKSMGFVLAEQMPASILANMKKTRAWKQILTMHDARYIFVALEGSDLERYHTALRFLPRAGVPSSIVPPWLGLRSSMMTPHHFLMQDVMVLHDTNRLKLPLPRLVKRVVDVTLSALALFFLLPIFAAIAVLVRSDGGPAFFKQPRLGKGGQSFLCYKFRSMRVDAEAVFERYLSEHPEAAKEWGKYQKLKDDVRVTKVGKVLRRFSIDELPQLINVLKGDMSIVGPRPCMAGQECFYAEDFSFYESVRPGITGPWQVSGRNKLTFKERVDLEAWYARNWSLWLDIIIMLKTIPTVLSRGQAF